MNIIEQADSLFRSGQAQQGLDLVGNAAKRNDPDALAYLASLSLSGQVVHRDLSLSRDLFRRAADAGHEVSARVYRAFVANGTGALPDWLEAMRLLSEAAISDPLAKREHDLIAGMELTDSGDPDGEFERVTVSESPEAYVYTGLFSEAECDFLTDVSLPLLEPSNVVDPISGEQRPNPVRTSDAASFPLAIESPAIHALCRRLAAASGTKVGQGEPLQVLRYRPGEQYRPHFDAINQAENQRVLTFLVYLNDDFEGGETHFLTSDVKVKGRKGDGLLFRNADDSGRPDPNSQHAGLPVTAGEKFLASRWIRERPLQY